MAAETVTAADVAISSNASTITGILGATGTQGQVVYKDTAASNVMKLAQCDGTAIEAGSGGIGILVTAGASTQKCIYCTKDPAFDPGFTATEGVMYAISGTAGSLQAVTELVSTNRITNLGVGNSDGTIDFDPKVTGSTVQ